MNKWARINLATEHGLFAPMGVYADFGTALSIGGSLLGAAMQGDAAESAANTQAQSAENSTAEMRRQFNLNRQDSAPWRDAGSAAVDRLGVLLGLEGAGGKTGGYKYEDFLEYAKKHRFSGVTPEDHAQNMFSRYKAKADPNWYTDDQQVAGWLGKDPAPVENPADFGLLNRKFSLADRDADPVYQAGLDFGLKEGTGAINSRALSSGMYDSGATLKALTRFGNDYGSTKTGESRNRFLADQDTTYNRLAGISGTGQSASAQNAQTGTQISSGIANNMTDAGNARAAGIVGGANAWGNAAGGVSGAVNNYQNNEMLKKILGRGGYGGMSGSDPWGMY